MRHETSIIHRFALGVILAGSIALLGADPAEAKTRVQLGVLQCQGEGGWGAIITSKKSFTCEFTGAGGRRLGRYSAVVRKFGIDIGKTGKTALQWLVFGPARMSGGDYVLGSLEGEYGGVGADAAVGLGLGANVLIGGGENSLALQPISVQVQTGLSIAAGVQTLVLRYEGPAS